ncbi:loricrin-like [Belonocnema kinseyi]|uniref:loricrin-like n=1 Tax=Belonocnema kinseyi TaxID=2817044 RepID=UPI00143D0246|nr:loricrin-like [Belonocnema kinseyi]
MTPFIACMVVGLAGFALAEPPVSSGYNYNRPSIGGGGGGFSLGGGGGYSGGGGFSGGGGYSGGGGGSGGYTQVSTGGQTNEGASVDGALLEQIRQILLKEESQSGGGFGGSFGGGYSAPSSSYGAPSSSYGVPSSSYGAPGGSGRVVGIDLEGIRQAIQVAQFNQISQGSSGGYPSGPSGGYPSGPSGGGYPSGRPSGSYGAPF